MSGVEDDLLPGDVDDILTEIAKPEVVAAESRLAELIKEQLKSGIFRDGEFIVPRKHRIFDPQIYADTSNTSAGLKTRMHVDYGLSVRNPTRSVIMVNSA